MSDMETGLTLEVLKVNKLILLGQVYCSWLEIWKERAGGGVWMETSLRCDLWQKDSCGSERKGLQDKSCYNVWVSLEMVAQKKHK